MTDSNVRVAGIISELSKDDNVIRLKELESYIISNIDITIKFNELKEIQKKMVNAKEFNQLNQYKEYKKLYEKKYEELLDLPFVEEYIELADNINQELNNCFKIIENIIDKKLNYKND